MEIPKGSSECLICRDVNICFQWTDTHGIAQCVKCGVAYRILHYENDKRIEKQPILMLKPEFVEICREYWHARGKPMPGGFTFTGNPRYEVASEDERAEFDDYIEKLEMPILSEEVEEKP